MKKVSAVILASFLVTIVFFFPLLKGHVPFPGDLLVGQYAPYNTLPIDGYAPGAVPHKAQGIDVARELFPWKYQVIEDYKKGILPFWTPNQFSGTPLLANFQSGAFYPLNILFSGDFLTGWSLFIFITPLLSMIFMYLFLRELEIGKEASFFGSLVFAFSSYMVVWMEYGNIGHTMLWLPFMLFSLEKLLKKYDRKFLLLFLSACLSSFLAGYIQGYFYSMIIVLSYYLVRKNVVKDFSVRQILLFLFILMLPGLLGALQLLPTLSLFSSSSRGNYTLDQVQNLLNPIWYLVTVLVPDFFGHPATRNQWTDLTYIERVSYFGFLPFVFAVFAAIIKRKQSVVKLFSVVAIVTLFLTTDLYVTKFFYAIPIPVLSTTVPTRALSLFVFSGSILSAFGLEHFIKNKDKKTFGIIMAVVVGFIIALWGVVLFSSTVIHSPEWIADMAVAKRNLILPTGFLAGLLTVFGLSLKKKIIFPSRWIVLIGVFAITLFDLFYFFHKITPFTPKQYIYPSTPVISHIQKIAGLNRYWGYGSAAVISNFQMVDNTYSVEGNDPLHSKLYSDFVDSAQSGKPPQVSSRADSLLAPGFGNGNLTTNPYRQKALNLLGVKYLLHKNDGNTSVPDTQTFPTDKFHLVWQQAPWQIYENFNVAPRAFLTNSYRLTTKDRFFSDFYKDTFDESKSALLYDDPKLKPEKLTEASTSILTYSPDEVIIATKSNADALLFLSDTYYPEWQATIDGKQSPVYLADYAFRAVTVPEGEHTVRFYYEAESFQKGVLISIAGLVFSIILLIRLKITSL